MLLIQIMRETHEKALSYSPSSSFAELLVPWGKTFLSLDYSETLEKMQSSSMLKARDLAGPYPSIT